MAVVMGNKMPRNTGMALQYELRTLQESPNKTDTVPKSLKRIKVQHTTPETRLHTLWRGPMKVIKSLKGQYTLLDLTTLKEKEYHSTHLKEFIFNPNRVSPLDVARSGVPMQHRDTVENRGDHVLNISLREAMRTDGERTEAAINLELTQLMVMNVFAPVHAHRLPVDQRSRVIRSIMFLKQKLHPDGTPDKYKARLVAGGDQQDKEYTMTCPLRPCQRALYSLSYP
jgi:hypothetical protein